MSLTVADFIILSMCYCLLAQNVSPGESGSVFGVVGCKIYGCISTIAALAEIWTLTLVSVDRFQAIFHPLETKKRMSSVKVSSISNMDELIICPWRANDVDESKKRIIQRKYLEGKEVWESCPFIFDTNIETNLST